MAASFDASPPDTAVVQARLVIDPGQRGLLARLFRTEYAGLFAVVLPAFAVMGLPVPLGGTSNGFRTAVLREIGGWDAYNVTEDAEVGLRLFRLGYRTATITSATEEEAPHGARAWLKQRRRWLKGWMITLLVHGRRPLRLLQDCGAAGALAFFLLTGGLVVSALLEPIALLIVLCHLVDGSLLRPATSIGDAVEHVAFAICLMAGHVAAALTGLVGLARLGQPARPLHLLALPIYWLALSFAAWGAVRELILRPFHWEKTTHLLARMPKRGGPA
jgi:cellulose synthase/poly-beta-1,6-N-acetylglucosamine synthase-like glycosyltransferase